jgi:hypothetical protein
MRTVRSADADYPLGRSVEALRRLSEQAEALRPSTERAEAEVAIDSLEARLREEAQTNCASIPLLSSVLIGQWARQA